ncbi:MAG: AAA family ATPase, partial [Thermomicrobiales bacterium]
MLLLLGRDAEVATIDRIVAGARLGEAGRLAILGEPGAGKSALLEHAAETLGSSFRVLRATGTAAESGIAFAGLSQLFGGFLDLLGDLPARQADALAAALALEGA